MSGVEATARIRAVADGRGGTALPLLTGEGPLALRRTRSAGPQEAHVTLVGAMSAPLGGDRLAVEAVVEPGAVLRVGSAAATVSLPGGTGERAHYDVRLTVGEGAELHWLPEPLIAAGGSDLRMTTTVELAPGARLVLREEQILGRVAASSRDASPPASPSAWTAARCWTRSCPSAPTSPAGRDRPCCTPTARRANCCWWTRSTRTSR